jgi:hypothetical protein
MWFWIIQVIAGSILGSATAEWFRSTRLGVWFFKKVSDTYDWAADRYNLKVLDSENAWKKKYPNISYKIEELEDKICTLEGRRPPQR